MDFCPLRPGVFHSALIWRFRQNFQLTDAFGPLTIGRPDAVRAGIAATNDDDMFIGCQNVLVWGYFDQSVPKIIMVQS